MEDMIVSPYTLLLLFCFIAFAYSSVGLGGGSSYTVLMAVLGVSTAVILLAIVFLTRKVLTV